MATYELAVLGLDEYHCSFDISGQEYRPLEDLNIFSRFPIKRAVLLQWRILIMYFAILTNSTEHLAPDKYAFGLLNRPFQEQKTAWHVPF